MLLLGESLAEHGCVVDVVVGRAHGPLAGHIPFGVRVVELGTSSIWEARKYAFCAEPRVLPHLFHRKLWSLASLARLRPLPGLVRYFRQQQPSGVIAAEPHYNLMSVWAKRLAKSKARVLVTEHVTPSSATTRGGPWRERTLFGLLRGAYSRADAIAAVSDGVADDLASFANLPRQRIATIYNPVVDARLLSNAQQPIDHPWFGEGQPPVILGVGRLHSQKDFATLITAFKRVRAERPARLLILGEDGSEPGQSHRSELEQLAGRLGVADDVSMPGFASNPFAFMSKANVFVLSSAYEGLGNALIEAMACGCPVVSTDCLSGPREILDNGRYGPLVKVGDAEGLAQAIGDVLDSPVDKNALETRASMFTVDGAARKYLEVLSMRP